MKNLLSSLSRNSRQNLVCMRHHVVTIYDASFSNGNIVLNQKNKKNYLQGKIIGDRYLAR